MIYFYNDGPANVRAHVDVNFPQGVITETYPAPVSTFPTRESEPRLGHGHTVWDLDVTTARFDKIPAVPEGNIYGHARNVPAANIVRSGRDSEKFLFYRGLGRFQPSLQITSDANGLDISYPPTKGSPGIPAAFLVHVDRSGRVPRR